MRTGRSITPFWSAPISVSPINLGDVLGASAMLTAASSARVTREPQRAAEDRVPILHRALHRGLLRRIGHGGDIDRQREAAPRMAFGPRHLNLGGRGRRTVIVPLIRLSRRGLPLPFR